MNINNFTQLYNLIKESGLQNNSPFDNFVKTVDQYIALCNCAQPREKEIKLKECKQMYEYIAVTSISSYAYTIKIKHSVSFLKFYNNGNLIATY